MYRQEDKDLASIPGCGCLVWSDSFCLGVPCQPYEPCLSSQNRTFQIILLPWRLDAGIEPKFCQSCIQESLHYRVSDWGRRLHVESPFFPWFFLLHQEYLLLIMWALPDYFLYKRINIYQYFTSNRLLKKILSWAFLCLFFLFYELSVHATCLFICLVQKLLY